MTKTAKIIMAVIVAGGIVGGGIFLYILVTAPRMSVQPHVRTYQTVMADAPRGSVPVKEASKPELKLSDDQALRVGRQCYDYYCVFCHGWKGDGAGPVGQSYDVAPADLRDGRIARMTDAEIAAAMMKGIGHEPVLGYVVPVEYRAPLVRYVRTFAHPARKGAGS